MEKKYEHVFTPLTIRGQTLKNRIAAAPFVSCLTSPDGAATAETIRFFEEMSKTGVAYVTIGDTQIDHVHGAAYAGEVNVTSDLYNGSLYSITEAIHRYGAKASIELSHSGRGADKNLIKDVAFAPSDLPLPNGPAVKVMDEEDMEFVKNKFVECAKRCERAGFDIIMFHCAHNNLFAQFLSPASNVRTDEYGGSLENRMRYPLSVIKAVREALNPATIMEMRISGDEMTEPGLHFDESLAFAKEAEKYVDIVHFSRGNIFDVNVMRWTMPNYMMKPGYNVEFSSAAKKVLNCKVAVVGGFETLEHAEKVLADGDADIVAMAHALIADQDLIHKSVAGREEDVRPCLRCQEGCGIHPYYGYPVRCVINPAFGRWPSFDGVKNAAEPKKVVVVGGGPAGMTAAQTLSSRGHKVVLFEKSGELGGMLHEAGATEIKFRIERYAKWMAKQTYRCGAEIRLNTVATPDLIMAEAPDEVVIATGSVPIRPQVPGIDLANVHMFSEVDHGRVEMGDSVLFCGAGLTGMESAIQQAIYGKKVKIIDLLPLERFGEAFIPMYPFYIQPLIKQYGIELEGDCRVIGFTEEGAMVRGADGKEKLIKADDIVISLGLKPVTDLFDEVAKLFPFHTHMIGDCAGIETIRNATRAAYELGNAL